MAAMNGFAVGFGVCINGTAGTIVDNLAATFYNAQLTQSMDMREEPTGVQEFQDCEGVLRTRVVSGSKRTLTITLIPTSGVAGAAQIALAEDEVKLPAIGEVLTLAGFQGPTATTGEINGDWIFQGNGRVVLSNTDAVRLEVELEQVYDDSGAVVSLAATT
jgi:hypothetical protein